MQIDWSKAPEWAQWVAQDEDGEVWFFESEPINDNSFDKKYGAFWYSSSDGNEEKTNIKPYCKNWLSSKMERPQ